MNKTEGEGRIRRHPKIKDDDKLFETYFPGKHTIPECFEEAVKKYSKRPCMGSRKVKRVVSEKKTIKGEEKTFTHPIFHPLKYLTYEEVFTKVKNFATGVTDFAGLKHGDKIGLYFDTCQEWMMAAQGCFIHGIIVVTCYANLGFDALEHVVGECELTTLVTTSDLVGKLEKLKDKLPNLKNLVIVDDKDVKSENFKIAKFSDLSSDKEFKEPEKRPAGDDLSVIMYTSGSTGLPKGVMITHSNIVSAAGCIVSGANVSTKDVYLAYLPLAHILECVAENALLFRGASLGYGTPRTLTSAGVRAEDGETPKGDIQAVRPSIMAGVPRVWDTIKKGAMSKIEGSNFVKRWLFNSAYSAKSKAVRNGKDTPWWNYLVFNNFSSMVGGRMRVIISGGAPMSAELHEFLKCAFSCAVVQGYGLTETCGGCCIQDIRTFKCKNVGHPIKSCEVKLVDVPEMGYTSKDSPLPRGEVAIKGNNVSIGYFKNEKKTKEDFRDGWFYTGDIGQWNEDGTLSIVDRKKNLVKLSHGEYVAIENLEMIYNDCEFVAPNSICLYADSFHDDVVGVMLPNKNAVLKWAKSEGIDTSDYKALATGEKLRKEVISRLADIARKNNKKKFEYVKNIRIYDEEWTPENEMLTAAQKLKRGNIVEKHKEDLDKMLGKKS